MKASTLITIVYIDHEIALKIVKQTSLIISFIDKLNLRLMRAFDYLQRFNLNIRHKSKKQHIISDVLFKLFSNNCDLRKLFAESELNALLTKKSFAKSINFIAFLIEINSKFKQRILNEYKTNLNWQRIVDILEVNDSENVAKLSFYRRENDLIFRFDQNIENHDY